jgi:hypothetical protein
MQYAGNIIRNTWIRRLYMFGPLLLEEENFSC